MDLFEARYSARAYQSRPVERDKLDRILRAALLAPTAANRQAFHVHVISTRDRETQLRRVYGRPWFIQAPLVLAVVRQRGQSWVRADGVDYGSVDCAIVMDHMVLAATEEGLGTCWVANFEPKAAAELLQLSPIDEAVVFTPLGYAADGPPPKKRKGLEEMVRFHGIDR